MLPRSAKVAAVAALLAASAVPASLFAPSAQAGVTFSAYHGVTSDQHSRLFHELRAKGYRPITVNVSQGPRYAGVWVKGASRPWVLLRGMSDSVFQDRFDEYLEKGYQPVSVSATGTAGDDAVFAVIWEKRSERFLSRKGMTGEQFEAANRTAAAQGLVPVSIDVYGTADDPRYVAVWRQGTGSWYYTYGKSVAGQEKEFAARTAKGYRPTLTAVGPDGTYTAVWRKDGGGAWMHYIDMSSAEYQQRFDAFKAKGLYPVQVNTEAGRYAAVWES
ncbi:hypothetical protein ACFXJ8_16325 [Nonomuraea sp. NPDC059194]|uniref:hypothetical protein n=1 Tax=Nonomuraea sp. NPDC059194 TaxID=3346764 RepID=UPI0036846144